MLLELPSAMWIEMNHAKVVFRLGRMPSFGIAGDETLKDVWALAWSL